MTQVGPLARRSAARSGAESPSSRIAVSASASAATSSASACAVDRLEHVAGRP